MSGNPTPAYLNQYSYQQYYPPQAPRFIRRPRRKPAGQDPLRYGRPRRIATSRPDSNVPTTSHFSAVNTARVPGSQAPYNPQNLPFAPPNSYMPPPPRVSYAYTAVWKSEEVLLREEWQSALKRVRHIAPGFVKAGLFPSSAHDWRLFKTEQDVEQGKAKLQVKEQTPTKAQCIRPVFGVEGKASNSNHGPVLATPTIWSQEFTNIVGTRGGWPSQAELLIHGDQRPKGVPRSFPPPRWIIAPEYRSYHDQAIISPYPLDKVTPLFLRGPSYHTFHNVKNQKLFKHSAWIPLEAHWIGSELMVDIGYAEFGRRTEEEVQQQEKVQEQKEIKEQKESQQQEEAQQHEEASSETTQQQTDVETVQAPDQDLTPSDEEASAPQPQAIFGDNLLINSRQIPKFDWKAQSSEQ